MCPACLSSAAIIAAGATSAGGLLALLLTRVRVLTRKKKTKT